MNTIFNYEADWRPYAYPEDQSHLAEDWELKRRFKTFHLTQSDRITAAGIPILSDGKLLTCDTDNSMNIIFGATGSKKSRVLVAPYICACAQAEESMIIPDIKGELSTGALSSYVRGALEANDYNVRVIDFRNFSCDGRNILLDLYYLYRNGEREEAMAEVNKLISSLASIYQGSNADPFWEKTGVQYLMSVIILMFELCDEPAKINMLSLASYTNEQSANDMRRVVDQIECDNNIMTMLRSVVSEPDKTRMSTLATVNSFFSDFILNERLLKMLSTNTFELEELYNKKTALFLILPDETDAYKGIAGMMLSQISSFLVREAYKAGGALSRRVNYICDEFCQYFIPNMGKNIASHRSRNIRWTIVCQSRKQLEAVYKEDAPIILANCTNLFFLSSPEPELLEALSLRAGYTNKSANGEPQRLISVANLRNMKKGWDYTDVYFASGSLVCVTNLPDISLYEYVEGFEEAGTLPLHAFADVKAYSSENMLRDIQTCRAAYDADRKGIRRLDPITQKAAERYRNLFGSGI